MGSGHDHGTGGPTPLGVERLIIFLLAPLLAATALGIVLLWPTGTDASIEVGDFVAGTVTSVEPCAGDIPDCEIAIVTVEEGPDTGDTVTIPLSTGAATPDFEPGTSVLLQPVPESTQGYALVDVDRTTPLLLLSALFAAAVVLLAGWKGVSALVGLAASMGVLAVFVLPSLLSGNSPVWVAAVGASAIAILSMGLAHGFNARTGVALIGTMIALLITASLGSLFTSLMNFTGVGTEDAAYLQAVSGGSIDLRGLLLAGLVIGALGVLDDVTVTQVASVWEVHGAAERSSLRDLWAAGMRVGRDHVAAVVNTLVLAYVGASLPLFLLITLSDAPLLQSLNNEAIASEIVRSMVGSLGIIAAVPITTFLAAWLIVDAKRRRAPVEAVPADS